MKNEKSALFNLEKFESVGAEVRASQKELNFEVRIFKCLFLQKVSKITGYLNRVYEVIRNRIACQRKK